MPKINQPPKGTYKEPKRSLVRCPHCDKVLNQHIIAGGGVARVSNNVNRNEDEEEPIRLFDGVNKNTPAGDDGTLMTLVEAGDIYVEEPLKLKKQFEHVKTGQARPHKREGHTVPGAPKKPIKAAPTPPPQPLIHPNADGLKPLDHPTIGGKVTICVLLYGKEHHSLHRRCLTSIVETVPPSRMDLRVGCNEVGIETVNFLKTLPITKIYERQNKNLLKYPVMRWMFHDPEKPIETKYVIWFDDDSYVLNDNWLSILAETITAQRPNDKVGCYGHRMVHPLNSKPTKGDPRRWFQNAKWFRGQHFQDKRGRTAPNGSYVHFPVGGFWCISKEAIDVCDIPDERLRHNGGDICIGAQLYQNGFKTKMFNEKKQFIKTSGAPRRGFHETFQWHK